MDGLDVEIKVKVVLYALFDKVIIRQCGSVYDAVQRDPEVRGHPAETQARLRPIETGTVEGGGTGRGTGGRTIDGTGSGSLPDTAERPGPIRRRRRPTAARQPIWRASCSTRFSISWPRAVPPDRAGERRRPMSPSGGRRNHYPATTEVAAAAKAEILAALSPGPGPHRGGSEGARRPRRVRCSNGQVRRQRQLGTRGLCRHRDRRRRPGPRPTGPNPGPAADPGDDQEARTCRRSMPTSSISSACFSSTCSTIRSCRTRPRPY